MGPLALASSNALGYPAGMDHDQEIRDVEHLGLLTIFHYVAGGLQIFFSSFLIFHVVFFTIIENNPEMMRGSQEEEIPPELFTVMRYFLVALLISGWTVGGLTILSGRRIAQRRARSLSLVMAGLNCLWIPFGTALGVCTFLVLGRESVRDLYDPNTRGP